MRILITRPLEDGAEIAARLAEKGHQAVLAPLLRPRFEDGPEPDFRDVQAVLATSANGIRALARRTPRRDLPVFAVGPQSAEAARALGFDAVRHADGDAKALADAAHRWASREGVLLHVASRDAPGELAEDLAARGFAVRRLALYGIEAASQLPPQAAAALKEKAIDGALFFSPRSARIFRELADGLPTEDVTAFCISAATAEALAPRAFAHIRIAARPNQAAMLALLD